MLNGVQRKAQQLVGEIGGIAPNLVVFRLTWAASASATISGVIVTNTGGGNGFEYASSITIPLSTVDCLMHR